MIPTIQRRNVRLSFLIPVTGHDRSGIDALGMHVLLQAPGGLIPPAPQCTVDSTERTKRAWSSGNVPGSMPLPLTFPLPCYRLRCKCSSVSNVRVMNVSPVIQDPRTLSRGNLMHHTMSERPKSSNTEQETSACDKPNAPYALPTADLNLDFHFAGSSEEIPSRKFGQGTQRKPNPKKPQLRS